MQHPTKKNIEEVVKHHLCVCCGTCMSVCPQSAIVMAETAAGLLIPDVNNTACNSCGLCLKVCPGSHLEKGLLSSQMDPFRGNCISAYCGKAAEVSIHQNGQSGGIVTAMLVHLLGSGRINNAVVTQMPDDGSLRPKSVVTSDIETIRKSQASKYCPVALGAVGQKILAQIGEKVAIVGLACHMHGLENARVHLGGAVPFRIGLVCDRIMLFGAIDYLVDKAGANREDVAFFQFRSKKFEGYPGDVYVRMKDGTELCLPNKHRGSIKDIYTPSRCRLCFDKMNVLCDLVVGDAWGISKNKQGCSVVISRTTAGQEALLSAQKAGILYLEKVDEKAIFKGQAIEKKRLEWTAFTAAWKDLEKLTPEFNIDRQWFGDLKSVSLRSYRNKIDWAMRIANMTNRSEILDAAKRQVCLDKIRFSLSFRGLNRFIRKIIKPLEHVIKSKRPTLKK